MGCFTASAYRLNGANAESEIISGIESFSAERLAGVNAYCYLVCEISSNNYLRVKPVETQWIDIDIFADFHVVSNDAWMVV